MKQAEPADSTLVSGKRVSEKEAWRRRFRAYRRSLSESEYASRSAAIVERAAALPELRQAQTVHAYWPMVDQREVDTRALIAACHARQADVVLPVVTRFDRRHGPARLRHARYARGSTLRKNRWGLEEPAAGPSVPLSELDVVLVPALGADRRGFRIGHGFGYYDEFLAPLSVPTILLCYQACLADHVPAAAHDVPVSLIVTEDEVVRPGQTT